MNKLILDIESGGVALLHDLTEPPTDGSALPAELAQTVEKFGESLGLPVAALGGPEKGFLFDVINAAVEAIGGDSEGHTVAGAPAAPAASQVAAASAHPAEPVETAPISEDVAAQTPAAESAAVPPLNTATTEHGPADADLPPVTTPKEGFEICPKCSGFRTVLDNGQVVPCPTCLGAGEVAIGTAAA